MGLHESRSKALLLAAAFGLLAAPSYAQVPVVFGTTWDGPGNDLQTIVDGIYGPGMIDVANDYIGAGFGDPDPAIWNGLGFDAYLITEVAGNANNNVLGWYVETGAMPVIDGADDGVVFTGPASPGASTIIYVGVGQTDFGFYMNPNGPGDAINAPEPELFFTNRFWNDLGPAGGGAVHAPFDGDVQALIYDVSAFTQPYTWLVCFEDLDYGADPSPCCTRTDNDFNDLIFEVTVLGAVPTADSSFGKIKSLYAR